MLPSLYKHLWSNQIVYEGELFLVEIQLIDAEGMIPKFNYFFTATSEIKSVRNEHNERQTLSERVMANVEMETSDQHPLSH